MIQPNLNPWDKWEAGNLQDQLEMYLELSSKAVGEGAKILIWPETALPRYLLSGNYPAEVSRIHRFINNNNVFLITGMPDANFYYKGDEIPEDAKPSATEGVFYTSYNSVLMFTPDSREVQKYGKIKLVPFGEKVPLVEYIPFLGDLIKWNVGITSWNVGKDTVIFKLPLNHFHEKIIPGRIKDTLNAAGVVCIESIYPGFISAFVKKGAEFIAVVTNDSWYGNSSGPYQHKEFSVLRAIENRRSVVRAANGGISCIIDPLGNTLIDSKMFVRTFLVGDVEIRCDLTFYTKNPLIIPIISSAVSLWILGLVFLTWLKKVLKI